MTRRKSVDRDKAIVGGIFLGVAGLLVAGYNIGLSASKDTRECTVTGKYMSREAATKNTPAKSIYQVETEQCGVVRVEDNWVHGVFNSADLYAQLREGQTHRITTVGWRIPPLSQFPTVTKVEQS